jgi:hypothetical protein
MGASSTRRNVTLALAAQSAKHSLADVQAALVSYRMLVDGTGLSKRSVQTALAWLVRRRLVRVKRKSPTDASTVTVHRDWRG